MSKTVIQAELPPDLVTRARDFALHQARRWDLNEVLVEALQDFLRQHPLVEAAAPETDERRQRVLDALAAQTADCGRSGWDGHGADSVTQATYRQACRLIEHLPAGFPMPSVGAEPDGHLTLEWCRAPSRVLSLSIGPGGELSYAALLGDSSRRTGSELFEHEVPADLLQLIQQIGTVA